MRDRLAARPAHDCRAYFEPVVLVPDDWLVDAPWFMFEVAFVLLVVWFADTPLVTSWLPLPTCTPGLTLAPAFTDEFAIPTLASTPTFGLTLVLELLEGEVELPDALEGELVDDEVPEPEVPDEVDWFVLVPWFIVEVEPTSVEDWLALTPLFTDWLPLPMFTPGLTFAPRLTSVLLIPTFASTPAFGFTLSEEVEGDVDDVLPLEGEAEELLLDEGEVLLVDGEEAEPDEADPLEVEPLRLPEDVVPPVAPLVRLLVPVVPARSLPPEVAAPLVETPPVAALVP